MSVSGIFQGAEDFAVLELYHAYDYYNHLRVKHLPRTDLSGITLAFDIEYDHDLDGAMRFGTMTGGATALWVAIGHYTDAWTSGQTFHTWGACLQQGDPKRGYARTWGYQTGTVAAGVACEPLLVVAKDNTEASFTVRGPGSNLSDHTLLQVTSGGEIDHRGQHR